MGRNIFEGANSTVAMKARFLPAPDLELETKRLEQVNATKPKIHVSVCLAVVHSRSGDGCADSACRITAFEQQRGLTGDHRSDCGAISGCQLIRSSLTKPTRCHRTGGAVLLALATTAMIIFN